MAKFLDNDFFLYSETARELYHEYAAPQPIYDYHSHLLPQQIADNHRYANLYEIWLAGDHYKWRAMRAAGVDERFCTGDASPWEKFHAYARTVPQTLRNPLYHWTHLELQRYFAIEDLLNEDTAESIWNRANEQLAEMPIKAILKKFNVAIVCTTDDPTDPLIAHQTFAKSAVGGTRMYPAFRPDKALLVDQPQLFNTWVDRLAAASNIVCGGFGHFLDALRNRHDFFHSLGCRLSDHGMNSCPDADCSDANAARIFDAARIGQAASGDDIEKFRSYLMVFFGQLDSARGWTKQLHLGALRNVSSRGFAKLGPDTGFDSIGDWPQAAALGRYLNRLDRDNRLPKMVLYNNNPNDNYALASMAGNFQDGTVAGKIQFGSGWWFLDQKDGMEWQMNALSNVGLLSRFVGMLTDSRSFMSFPRHEYFRRILCNLIGRDVDKGELPKDMKLLGSMVADISFRNAQRFFGLEVDETFLKPKR